MLSRRGFVGCALCAAAGFVASGAGAEDAPPGFKRTILNQLDGPMEGYVTLTVRVDVDPGAAIARHTHPGIEASYLIAGGISLAVDGKETRTLAPGDAFEVPPGVPHSAKNGDAKSTIAATYVVEKGKPLASPA